MKNEPRRHHYIPRFILRNFLNENKKIFYWNKLNSNLEEATPEDIFMQKDLYRDETNHQDNPTYIEHALSKFETAIAPIISNINEQRNIKLTRRELELLRIYLALQTFRDEYRKEQYLNDSFDESTRNKLLKFQPDGKFEDLWKREIDELSKCRSYKDIRESNILDDVIKLDLFNLLDGYYMTILDSRGQDFIISDIYPTLEICPLINGTNIHMHIIFPISPNRIILLNHIMFKKEVKDAPLFKNMISLSNIKDDLVKAPSPKYKHGFHEMDDVFEYSVKNIYSKNVIYINNLILNEAREGIAFKDNKRIIDSLKEYNSLEERKNDYMELEYFLTSRHVKSFYDESGHTRKLTNKSFNEKQYMENFVACIVSFDSEKYHKIKREYSLLENKYKEKYTCDELKSEIITKSKYINGLRSFKNLDIEFISDYLQFLKDKDAYVYTAVVNKVNYLFNQMFLEQFKKGENGKAIIYSLTKIICKYNDRTLLQDLYSKGPKEFLKSLKIYLNNLYQDNIGHEIKENENRRIKEILPFINNIKEDIDFNWNYNFAFNSFRDFVNECNIYPDLLTIDKEGIGETFYSAVRCGIKNCIEKDSKEDIGVRIADIITGLISRMVDSFKKSYSYETLQDSNNKVLLRKEWFEIDENRFNLYKLMYEVIIKQNNVFDKIIGGIYKDTLLVFISFLEYMNGYKTYDEFKQINSSVHIEKFNTYTIYRFDDVMIRLTYNEQIEMYLDFFKSNGDIEDLNLPISGYLPLKDEPTIYEVCGILPHISGSHLLICTVQNKDLVAYLLEPQLYEWAFNLINLTAQGQLEFPMDIEFGIINERIYAEIK